MRLLLALAPMTQVNTPYPSTAQLAGFLKKMRGVECVQRDFSLELFLRLFSREGLRRVGDFRATRGPALQYFLTNRAEIEECVDSVVRFLQGKDPTLAYRIVSRKLLPEGPRLTRVGDSYSEFGALGIQDHAKHFASLFLDDLADAIRDGVDSRFEWARYGEKLSASQPRFSVVQEAVESSRPSGVDRLLDEIVREAVDEVRPDAVAISVPFSGSVYGAFRMARVIKLHFPEIKTVLGGGYVNTELRELRAPSVFDYFDFVTLDEGERPLSHLIEHWKGKRKREKLCRTFFREDGEVRFVQGSLAREPRGVPDYEGLKLDSYVSLLEMPNPMHRLWSDGRWNKLELAHGCYWKKCAFCDVSLPYIRNYIPSSAKNIVDQMERIAAQTGQTGFHFVDEAAPPALLNAAAKELIARKLKFTWWGNVRFEKAFSRACAETLAASGCVALTGGIEVASDRLLKLMQKGVSVAQVTKVTRNLTDAGILVHAYLMYGFPSETVQETVASLERVRRLFAAGCIQSAYWHRFALTVHSPIGKNPKKYGIRITGPELGDFARNDLEFEDPSGCTPEELDWLGKGLNLAVYNYMRGQGLQEEVGIWFEGKSEVDRV